MTTFRVSAQSGSVDHRNSIGSQEQSVTDAKWIQKGVSLQIKGKEIPGGMIYVGRGIAPHPRAPFEPSLVNPDLRVDWTGDYRESNDMDYWPSYNRMQARQRGAYLNWLVSGRRDPDAYIGFIFVFFYGLERRLLIDDEVETLSDQDFVDVVREVGELLQVYSGNHSFRRYATSFLGFIRLHPKRGAMVEQTNVLLPSKCRTQFLRVELGALTRGGNALPAQLVADWVLSDDTFTKRTAAKRCPEAFQSVFIKRYIAKYGEGIKLKANRTKLVIEYRPASGGLGRHGEFQHRLGDLPDLTAAPSLLKPIQALVDECASELEAYSRYMAKDGSSADSLEAILLLPAASWPSMMKKRVGELLVRHKVSHDGGYFLAVLTLKELLSHLNASGVLAKDKLRRLANGLEVANIGMEPDLRRQNISITADDRIVLFTLDSEADESVSSPVFETAALCLELAAIVAHADGSFDDAELSHLRDQLSRWTHLPRGLDRHLTALLFRLRESPSTLVKLRDRLSVLRVTDKQTIARVLTGVANADGTVTPKEVSLLEKIYKTLGLDAQSVYSDLHAGTIGAPTPDHAVETSLEPKRARASHKLNKERIAALQADSAKVGALLHSVFSEPVEEPIPVIAEIEEPETTRENRLGLDDTHAAFLHVMIGRSLWSRSDLEDVAADMDLMLNGALERINDASFDQFDMALTEGDDPIEVVDEALHALEHG